MIQSLCLCKANGGLYISKWCGWVLEKISASDKILVHHAIDECTKKLWALIKCVVECVLSSQYGKLMS